ncbi:hypothetical protein H1C71_021101, partial [Ictidomys tridecemlineatus]
MEGLLFWATEQIQLGMFLNSMVGVSQASRSQRKAPEPWCMAAHLLTRWYSLTSTGAPPALGKPKAAAVPTTPRCPHTGCVGLGPAAHGLGSSPRSISHPEVPGDPSHLFPPGSAYIKSQAWDPLPGD